MLVRFSNCWLLRGGPFAAIVLGAVGVVAAAGECQYKPPGVCPKPADPDGCVETLFHAKNFMKVGLGSGFFSSNLGDHQLCTNNNFLAPVGLHIAPMEICALELTDTSKEFSVQSHGICLPTGCDASKGLGGMLVGLMTAHLGNNSAAACTTKQLRGLMEMELACYRQAYSHSCGHSWAAPEIEQYKDFTSCVGNKTDPHHGNCCMPWLAFESIMNTTFATLDGFAELAPAGSAIELHCGDNEYKSFGADAGGIITIVISCVLVIASILAKNWSARATAPRSSLGGKGTIRVNANEYEDAALIGRDGSISAETPQKLLAKAKLQVAKIEGEIQRADRMTVAKAFNPSRNLAALFQTSATRTIGGLDCLKALSMFWIILAHSTLLSLLVGETDPDIILKWEFKKPFENQFTAAADKAVDTFFLVGGLLMAYTTIGKLRSKSGDVNLATVPGKMAIFIFARFMRLVPLYLFVILFYGNVLPHMGSGPIWYKMINESGLCRTNWWQNLLFINNFSPTNFHEQCMSWTWYLANDMQFFIVGLFVLVTYAKSKNVAFGLIGVVVVTSNVVGFHVLKTEPSTYQDSWYDKPWMRISPMLIGMAIGLLMRDTKMKSTKLPKAVAATLMSLAICGILFTIYITYTQFHPAPTTPAEEHNSVGSWTAGENAAFLTFGRMIFVSGIATLIMLGLSGNGGFVYSFISAPGWEPIGKLTYGAYLVHPVLLRGYFFQMTQMFDLNTWGQTYTFAATAALSYLLSAAMYVLIELPFGHLVGMMLAPLLRKK